MFFRNLTFFRFPCDLRGLQRDMFQAPMEEGLQGLAADFAECALKPVGPLELSSRGFISPFGRSSDEYAHKIGSAVWITVGGENRLLPASVVNELLSKKVDEIERKEGKAPGPRTRKRLKDELIVELLPQAFISPQRVDAYFDLDRGFIAVDTPSKRNAEIVVSEVRRAIGSFPALPLNAEVSPRSVFTGWVAGDAMPEGLQLGDECELRDPVDQGAVVKIQRDELSSDEVQKHLEAGKQCTRVALIYNDHVSFVLGEDLVVRKFKLLEGAVDALENSEREDLRAELDARFALMSGEVGELFDMLEKALRFSAADADKPSSSTSPPESGTADRIPPPAKAVPDPFIGDGDEDPLLPAAREYVVTSGKTTISGLQRQLKVGYNRAARLIEALEEAGVVSAPDPRGDRRVLTKDPVK